jgi:competence ComEA-like helix-hairpin-helix protein
MSFSPRQQVVLAVCCVFYGLYLCGTSIYNSRQSLIAFPLAEPTSSEMTFFIDPPVDVNTADIEELRLLPSIGPVLARRILEYREQYGSFSSVNELRQIHGIGPKTVQKLSHYLEFED